MDFELKIVGKYWAHSWGFAMVVPSVFVPVSLVLKAVVVVVVVFVADVVANHIVNWNNFVAANIDAVETLGSMATVVEIFQTLCVEMVDFVDAEFLVAC